ncbi:MAG: DUF1631 domain-containing protein [Thiopseudomonas sp.]|nr:DUF1631 domain-containing protein [Thiopseudomonas sp.]MBP7958372.1 DUF1631 domain-containing protein [Thiopseudomonas sp.]MBP8007923.1 DUF1631 domain-containing protein [Thiopseudomonas sp.]MBP8770258.1 DUF1631 domain-containing protein [Thiopseudomonas sp.]MBP9614180.1 DUF1631 domain-containing protein [Thiopseudomonas sp.]
MDRKILPQFNDLTQRVRKLLLNHLAQQVRAAFTEADSALFKCAEKAENNQVQDMFFESIREVRKQHLLIERAFLQNITAQFDSFVNGTTELPQDTDEIDADTLSLVQTDDFEESLLVTSMSKKVTERCMEPLYGIEQRLALINSGKKPGANSPLAPTIIATGFYTALTNSSFTLQIKTILYMLFEQFVMSELDQFYAAANKLFIEAGVLPNLKYSTAHARSISTASDKLGTVVTPSSPEPAAAPAAPAAQHYHAELSATPRTEHSPQSIPSGAPALQGNMSRPVEHISTTHSAIDESTRLQAETINTLLALYRQQQTETLPDGIQSISALVPQSSTLQYSVPQLLNSLNQLQKQAAEQAQQHFVIQSVSDIKSNLVGQLKLVHDTDAEHKIPEQHANTIDLVGMLFNFIIEDASLSDASKAILSNLHSLYLQVALQDKSLFTRHQHPARKLLNGMAQAGIIYCGASEENAIQQKMKFTVSQALQSFNGDSALFEYLLQDFNTFVDALQQRVELREKRAVEAAKGRDKLLAARNQARALVDNIISRFPPPSIIRNFLTQTWVDVLVFAFLRHGPASKQWQRYAEVAQQLAWSGTALEADEQKNLEALRLGLLEDLRKGLDLLGSHHPDMIRKLLQDLVACQHAVQARETLLAEQISPQLPESQLGTMLGEDAALSASPSIDNLSEKAQQFASQLEHIDFGTWFEFDNPTATLKLSWFSPTTRNYMFVDSSGQRVAIKALTSLAVELERGSARIITETRATPLMDRAFNAIQKIFQRFNHTQTSIG